MITPQTLLMTTSVLGVKLSLKSEMSSVSPVNYRQHASATPLINDVLCAAGSVT